MGYGRQPDRDIDIFSRKARGQGLPRVDSLVGSAEALSLRSPAFDEIEWEVIPLQEASPSLPQRIGQRVLQTVHLR